MANLESAICELFVMGLPTPANQPESMAFRLGHRPWLDGLRGVAILLVLTFHFGYIPCGFLGVDVFFVLSGFLITALLAEEWQRHGDIDLPRFYLRRALRLFPAYFALLALCAVDTALGPRVQWEAGFQEVLVAGAYISNWPSWHQTAMPRLGHAWSLAVEEQFYLIWPVVLLLLFRLKLKRSTILAAIIGLIALSAIWRAILHSSHTPDEPQVNLLRLYMGLDTRADALLVGCTVGLLAVWGWLPRSRSIVTVWGVAAVLSLVGFSLLCWSSWPKERPFYNGLFTVVAGSVAIILIRLLIAPAGFVISLLECRLLVLVGKLSYSLYLVHIPVIGWVGGWGLGESTKIAALGLTILAATASHLLIERPFLRLKSRIRRQENRAK